MLKKLSIYPKLVISFLLVIVPIYTLSLAINQFGKNSVREQITLSMKSQVHYYLDSFEAEIQQITKRKKEYMFDDDLQNLSALAPIMTEFDRRVAIQRLQKKISLFKESSRFLESAKLYIPLIGKTLYPNSFSESMSNDELQELIVESSPQAYPSAFFYSNEHYIISQLYPDPLLPQQRPVFALKLELSKDSIQKTLQEITKYTQGEAILFNARQNWEISDSIDSIAGTENTRDFIRSIPLNSTDNNQGTINWKGKSYLVTSEYSHILGITLLVTVPEDKVLGPLNKYNKWLWLLSALSAFVVVVFSFWIYRLIQQPLKRLVIAFRRVEQGNLKFKIHHINEDEFHYLYEQFNHMSDQLKKLIDEVYEQQIRSQRSELKQLQSQINPHFLYNSFFSMKSLLQYQNTETALKMADYLGEYFQFITRNGSNEVTLEAEVKHAYIYLEIQMIRFSRRVTAVYEELPEMYLNLLVPRLILQPMIENAFNYGLKDKVKDGRVEIRIAATEDNLVISVEDNGDILDEESLREMKSLLASSNDAMETTGLVNVHRRLKIKFGADSGLSVSRSELGGLKIELIIQGFKKSGGYA
ncbi:HAMP domain-containing protein [Paenibacillus psychroresistens]|uniref:HAMP domain-containing protein n=1 Tax=Paenibacillus psychroresistens TaxID=1778678 RepID=A0A6B8RHF2_9BACL|nr:histidine kinase [Paenibacillus psychroresistens]QGQ95154.1 HAMP domain-containing protein [Paenibacillus psychroresistens]